MSFAKFFVAAAAIASTAFAVSESDAAEINVVVQDINDHLTDYAGLVGNPDITIPDSVMKVYAAYASGNKDYTTMYDQLDMNQVNSLISALPWYSSRLEPQLATINGGKAAEASSKAPETTSTKAPETSSKAPETTKTESKTESSKAPETTKTESKTESSKAPETTKTESKTESKASTTKAETTSKATTQATSAKSSVDAVSQITDGQIQATISQQTSNGAGKVAAGMGAGVLAVAAMLI
ncbi:hypothetical protein TBLA_0J01865 [Henningerozyma blattae CBS 6284]|uniref:Temperature shock-inducible protein 1 n=1 Tax=Henningerozyma blattae (strain ATCC 34711 / CBS 6284 / DSM 70876 / NBRC 10599 / NRRL Y-10934 / UCD 77-7) TaxID=1071380 RepID=I2H9Y0_HENB6|nr:hypothetical protein TBLA_0J01865 [Tetrapisispora blattae CBS 6284]CCH63182.1 hypothetical protein TBLA_0J01865 [Tetrapisispora blattae CBS 6284]